MRRISFLKISLLILLLSPVVPELNAQHEKSASDEFLYAQRLFDEEYYDLATDQLERYLRDYPDHIGADEAQFLLGEAYFKSGKLEKSRAAFLRIAYVFPESPRAPEALLRVGLILSLDGKPREAAKAYQRIQTFYPNDPLAPRGMYKAILILTELGDSAQAEATIERLVSAYPRSEITNQVRIFHAIILRSRDDIQRARAYLERVIARSGIDSIVATAYFELGRLNRKEWQFKSAEESFRMVINRYPQTPQVFKARLELADLLNYQGLIDDALAVVQPILDSQDRGIAVEAQVVAGDAYYLKGDKPTALKLYDKASADHPEAALKAAWTSELILSREDALKRYLKLIKREKYINGEAWVRAAVIANEIGADSLAAEFWKSAAQDTSFDDPSGRVYLEWGKTEFKLNSKRVWDVANQQTSRYTLSPFQDELYYLSALETEKNQAFESAVERFNFIIHRYPASPYSDSASIEINYVHNNLLKGDHLMEKMAELSSKPRDTVDPVKWSLDWGDFYLNEFKDPVRAIDQYDQVLDDIVATSDDRIYALLQSGTAYLRLYETALHESDEFMVEMYADSARNRMMQLIGMAPGLVEGLRLKEGLFLADLMRFKHDTPRTSAMIDDMNSHYMDYGTDQFTPEVTAYYLEALSRLGFGNAENIDQLFAMMENAASRTKDARIIARLKMFEVLTLAFSDRLESAMDSARALVSEFPFTSAGARAAWWLVEQPSIALQERLERLELYRNSYPYLDDPETSESMASQLLDSLGRGLEALEARERAVSAAEWGIPKLDILEFIDKNLLYKRGIAYYNAGQYARAVIEFKILLNAGIEGDKAPQALLYLAEIENLNGNVPSALAYLDTLESRFPFSSVVEQAVRLKLHLLITSGNYTEARKLLQNQMNRVINPDSIYSYKVNSIICLYRMDRLDEAEREGKELFKIYKKRDDYESTRALFILEKGLLYDRAKNFDEAQKQYRRIIDDYSVTKWVDDTAYAMGLSLVTMGKYDEGVEVLERFLEDFPASDLNPKAMLSLGMACLHSNKHGRALGVLKKVWTSETASDLWIPAFEALLSAYRDMRYWDAAIQLTRNYLSRFPDAPDALDRKMDVGQFYLQIGEWDEAVRHYRPLLLITDAEREAEIQYYIGEALQNKGDYRLAILEFLKVEILGRKTKLDWGITALYQAGICYERLEDAAGATRMYDRIIKETGAESNYGRAAKKQLDELHMGER